MIKVSIFKVKELLCILLEDFKTSLLFFSLSIFNMWQSCMGKYVQNTVYKKNIRLMSFKSNLVHTGPSFRFENTQSSKGRLFIYLTVIFMFHYHNTEHLHGTFLNVKTICL